MKNRHIPYSLFYLFVTLLLILFSCNRNNSFTKLGPVEQERKLDSLITLARLLPDNEGQDKLVSLYYQSRLTMDLVPDTSVVKAKAILFTMNKLRIISSQTGLMVKAISLNLTRMVTS